MHASQYAPATVYGDSAEEIEAAAIAACRAEIGDDGTLPLEVVPGSYTLNEAAGNPLSEQAAAGRRYAASPVVREVPPQA